MTRFSEGGLKGAIELISAGAILVGLVFVGFELRQNTLASQADTMEGLLELANQALHEIAVNPEFADLLVRADKNIEELSESEYLQYRSYMHADWNIWEHLFYSHLNGTMDEKLWESWDISSYSLYCNQSSRIIWADIEPFFGAEFKHHVSNISAEDCASAGL